MLWSTVGKNICFLDLKIVLFPFPCVQISCARVKICVNGTSKKADGNEERKSVKLPQKCFCWYKITISYSYALSSMYS